VGQFFYTRRSNGFIDEKIAIGGVLFGEQDVAEVNVPSDVHIIESGECISVGRGFYYCNTKGRGIIRSSSPGYKELFYPMPINPVSKATNVIFNFDIQLEKKLRKLLLDYGYNLSNCDDSIDFRGQGNASLGDCTNVETPVCICNDNKIDTKDGIIYFPICLLEKYLVINCVLTSYWTLYVWINQECDRELNSDLYSFDDDSVTGSTTNDNSVGFDYNLRDLNVGHVDNNHFDLSSQSQTSETGLISQNDVDHDGSESGSIDQESVSSEFSG